MSPRPVLLLALASALAVSTARAEGPAPDPRVAGLRVPAGFRVRVVAAEPAVVAPSAMAFDDLGRLYVVERKPGDRTFETTEILPLPEGGTARIKRRRKSTLDLVKRLDDGDGDGVFEASEVVVEGVELPSAILPYKGSLLIGSVGRLERWSDADGDGRFETRAILVDGLAAGFRSLVGIALGPDGWLYLSTGDDDAHAIGPDGSRVDLARTGAVYRCRPDGSRLALLASGLRDPRGGVAFDAGSRPILVDDGPDDGSKFAGVRLLAPIEGGDYGWRVRPGPVDGPDFDRGSIDGERPGKLAPIARLGRGKAAGLVVYGGTALSEACRDLLILPDPSRQAVRGIKLESKGGGSAFAGETTLIGSDDPLFRPEQVVIGADGSAYVLDSRTRPDPARPWGEGPTGRIYRLTWEGDAAAASRPNRWARITSAGGGDLVSRWMLSPDLAEAARAQRELVDRATEARGQVMADARTSFLAYAGNVAAPPAARILGLQGARQLWTDDVEGAMWVLLADPSPEIRRLAAEALAWEPKGPSARLVPRLLERLDDPDPRVVHASALAVARHAEPRPQQPAVTLVRWLYAHPQADPIAREGAIRALERLGEAGVEEVALAVRTRRGIEREGAIGWFAAFRSAGAADHLTGLAKVPDLGPAERLSLVRQFRDIPVDVPLATGPLADWTQAHPETDPAVKLAALDACLLAGNPASSLIVALLDDDFEPVRLAATHAAARIRPPGSLARLAARLEKSGTSPAERLAVVRALRGSGPAAFGPLEAAYLGSDDFGFRLASLRSMAEANRAKAAPALEGALTGRDPGLRREAARILASTRAGLAVLIGAPADPAGVAVLLGALRKAGTPEALKRAAAIEAEAARGVAALDPAAIRSKAEAEGDPWSGLGVFARDGAVRCSNCHQAQAGGALAGIGDLGPDRMVEALLKHPAVAEGPAGERTRLASTDSRAPSGLEVVRPSPGPGQARSPAVELSPSERLDVVAFLLSKPTRTASGRGVAQVGRVLAVGPLAPGADKLRAPLDRVDPSRPLPGQDGALAPWMALDSTEGGVFELRGEFGVQAGRAYVAFEVRSDRDQAAALRFAIEGASRVYLNGARVAETPDRDDLDIAPSFGPAPPGSLPSLPDLARLELKAGPNLVVVAIDRSGLGDARARFEVAAPGPIELHLPRPGTGDAAGPGAR